MKGIPFIASIVSPHMGKEAGVDDRGETGMQEIFHEKNNHEPFFGKTGCSDTEAVVEQTPEEIVSSAGCKKNDPWPHFDYAHALEKAGREKEALKQYEKAVLHNDGSPWPHFDYAHALEKAGREKEALKQYEKAVLHNDGSPWPHFDYAHALEKAGREKEVLKQYEKAVLHNDGSPWPHFDYARKLEEAGCEEEALEQFRKSVRFNKSSPWPHFYLGLLALKLEYGREAWEQFNRSTELSPLFSWNYYYLGVLLEQDEDFEGARDKYKQAIGLNKHSSKFFWRYGRLLKKAGYLNEAGQYLRRAREMDPSLHDNESLKLINAWWLRSLDMISGLFLMALWTLLTIPMVIFGRIISYFRKDRPVTKVVFLSYEGHKVAPTRVRCYDFCDKLKRSGIDAEVFAYWDSFPSLFHFPFPFRRIGVTEKVCYNLRAFLYMLKKGRIIIVQQRPNYDFIVTFFLWLINGSRVVLDFDDWTLSYNVFWRMEVRHLLRFLSIFSDTCIVSSRCLKRRLGRHFRYTPILPTYVDADRFSPMENEIQKGPVVFSWVGTVFQDFTFDNVLFFMEAFARACARLGLKEDIQLDIIGGGDFFPKVVSMATEKYAEYNIRVRQWLPPGEIPTYLQGIDVGLYSLIEPSLFQKSKSPTKIFEYYACGKPVLSTALGEAKHFVHHGRTGLLVYDMESCVQGFIDLYESPELRTKMGTSAREIVETSYNLDQICLQLKKVLFPINSGANK